MASNSVKTFSFALCMCLICSIALTTARVGLKDMQDRNMKIDKQKNVLKSLSLIQADKKYSSTDIEEIYETKIQLKYMSDTGLLINEENDFPVYLVGTTENIERYAIPFKAYGLWSYIYGYIALEGDGNTIAGFTVYKNNETPGLGAEVEKDWYQNQFIGKKITDLEGKFVSIGSVKGKVKDVIAEDKQINYVDGISGATITADGVARDLKVQLSSYEPLALKLRS